MEALLGGKSKSVRRSRPWDSLGKVDRCLAVIASTACGFHSADIVSYSEKSLDGDGCINWNMAAAHLERRDNPVRVNLDALLVDVASLLRGVRQGDSYAVRELTRELNKLVLLPAGAKVSRDEAARHVLTKRAGYLELLESKEDLATEAKAQFEKLKGGKIHPE